MYVTDTKMSYFGGGAFLEEIAPHVGVVALRRIIKTECAPQVAVFVLNHSMK